MIPKRSFKNPLINGTVCLENDCIICCLETEMLLSNEDLTRINEQGYSVNDFATRTDNGWQIKNNNGRCFFLSDNRCGIYDQRPEGCRIYPLVFDITYEKPVLDNICRYRHEFFVTKEDIKNLKALHSKLQEENSV